MKFLLWLLFLLSLPANLIFSQKEESEGTFSSDMFGDCFYNINRDESISSIPYNALSGIEIYERPVYNQYYKPSVTARITFFYSYHE